jgi:hypothetical protein
MVFSRWMRWDRRSTLEGVDFPGVYLLAHYDSTPIGNANPLAREVIYIGETCDNSLSGRWRQFNRAAFNEGAGHSGGVTYRQLYGSRLKDLFVAALPVRGLSDEIRPLFIRYVERKLIYDFARAHGVAPKCNKK